MGTEEKTLLALITHCEMTIEQSRKRIRTLHEEQTPAVSTTGSRYGYRLTSIIWDGSEVLPLLEHMADTTGHGLELIVPAVQHHIEHWLFTQEPVVTSADYRNHAGVL